MHLKILSVKWRPFCPEERWVKICYKILQNYTFIITAISLNWQPDPPITKLRLKISYLKFLSNLPGANELMYVLYSLWCLSCNTTYCDGGHTNSRNVPGLLVDFGNKSPRYISAEPATSLFWILKFTTDMHTWYLYWVKGFYCVELKCFVSGFVRKLDLQIDVLEFVMQVWYFFSLIKHFILFPFILTLIITLEC